MCKIVSKLGFEMAHQTGSHTVWKHKDGRTTTIPIHPEGKKLPRGLIRKMLNDINLSN
ncbi:MAG TPA: addiction module toxin, HicA family [Euryarchaeota archaeon]|nr:addiction module toxin, HicA family [Euryarchaeota archaeon]